MNRSKRYTQAEISAMLAQAEQFAKEGKTQSAIAHALGISVMTFHRWRKMCGLSSASTPPTPEHLARITALQRENTDLRRMVTDLLLERVKLEEKMQQLAPQHD
jgi:putative transposase